MDGLPLGVVYTSQVDFAGQVLVFQGDPFIHDEKADTRDDPHEDAVRIPEELVHIEVLGNLDENDGQWEEGHVEAVGFIAHEQGGGTHPAEQVQAAWQKQQVAEGIDHGNGEELVLGRIDVEHIVDENTRSGVDGTDPEPLHAEDIELLGQTGMKPEKRGRYIHESAHGESNLQVGYPGGGICKNMHVYRKHDDRQDKVGHKHTSLLLSAEYVTERNVPEQYPYEMGDCHGDRHQNRKIHSLAP